MHCEAGVYNNYDMLRNPITGSTRDEEGETINDHEAVRRCENIRYCAINFCEEENQHWELIDEALQCVNDENADLTREKAQEIETEFGSCFSDLYYETLYAHGTPGYAVPSWQDLLAPTNELIMPRDRHNI